MKILFIVGSFKQNSFNKQLASYVENQLLGHEVSYLDYKKLPLFNQDLEVPVLPEVQEIRNKISNADLIWFFSPVYNHAIPGTVKNLLDWLSRSIDITNPESKSIIHEKMITLTLLAASGHESAFKAYETLFRIIRTDFVDVANFIKINNSAWTDGKLVLSDMDKEALKNQIESVFSYVKSKN